MGKAAMSTGALQPTRLRHATFLPPISKRTQTAGFLVHKLGKKQGIGETWVNLFLVVVRRAAPPAHISGAPKHAGKPASPRVQQ